MYWRLKLLEKTEAPYEVGVPSGLIPVVELNDTTFQLKVAGKEIGLSPDTPLPSNPPATNTSPGVVGTVTWDASKLYVCIAENTWAVATLTTSW